MLNVEVMLEDRTIGALELFASRLSLKGEQAGVLSYLGLGREEIATSINF